MRALVVTNMYPTPERPAYGSFVRSQVESLRAAGVDVDVLFIDGRTSAAEYLRGMPRVRRAAREPVDLVHAHYGLSGWVAARQRRLPLVITYHGDDLLETPRHAGGSTFKSRVARRLGLRAAARARALIVQSRQMLEALPAGPIRDRARILPMGLDLELFRPLPREECCRRLELDPGRRRILFVGGVDLAVKRFPLAAAAVGILHRRDRPADLHVVHGQPPETIPRHMNACDVLLLTSVHEGSPMVVKEALACGLPVVSVDVGDVAERLQGVAGCHVVEAEVEKVAAALDEVLRAGRRVDGRAAVEELSLPRVAARVKAVYEEVLRGAEA